ncbi:class I SAM-dependent methyltransferase [Azospirillum sp. B2RO_4]|uniref:class I SAM-dependent methyltransferase n=1 Tax=Azospirillum sp. B2RO_4 TaxID=3027796 RepID=UPI003DA9B89A
MTQDTWQRPPLHSTEFDPGLHRKFLVQSVPNFVEHLQEVNDILSAADEYRGADGQNLDPIRIVMFFYFLRMTHKLAPGDYMECGTFRGFSARMIWRWMDQASKLYCFDTFEGFAEPDVKVETELYQSNWTVGNFQPTSEAMVRGHVLGGDESRADQLSIVKGWLPASFEPYADKSWRFVHLDMDLYLPHKEMIERVWPKLVPGGILLMHDYHNSGFPGVKKSADEYLNPLGISCVPLPDWGGSAVAIKPLV